MALAIWPASICAFLHLGLHFDPAEDRQEQRGQDGDDADDDEQFDQGEGAGERRSPRLREGECQYGVS